MLTWSIIFLVIAIVAAIFGFWAVAGAEVRLAHSRAVAQMILRFMRREKIPKRPSPTIRGYPRSMGRKR